MFHTFDFSDYEYEDESEKPIRARGRKRGRKIYHDPRPRSACLKIPFSVMNVKIRQYLSANMLRPAAKVFDQSVDISLSGFGRQLSS